MKLNVYSVKGVKKATTSLPESLLAKENLPLLAQAIYVYEDRKHLGLAKVKTRGEVDRSKRKIYRQKGTGGARHGSRNAPIFVGGGIAHGPKGVKRVLRLPGMLRLASLRIALSLKAKEKNLIVLDQLNLIKKTKELVSLIKKIAKETDNPKITKHLTLVLSEKNKKVAKFARNISNLDIVSFRNLNALSIYLGGFILIDKEVFSEAKVSDKKDEKRLLKKRV